ncbi:MAG: 5-methylthioadenosine/S-adenosylhomocysteine nucleosidase [Pseudomonadota bacterium]
MRALAIVSALQEELAAVLLLMQSQQKQTIAGRDFWFGQLHGHAVIVVLSRIGKVAAAATATILMERFAVQNLVFIGVAGGLHSSVQVGDVVVATEFLQHDMDASPLFPRFEIPLTGVSCFVADALLSQKLVDAVSRALPRAPLHRGLMISGDRFVSTRAESLALQTALPDALAVEMEGAAIAQVCADYGVAFAAVRTISDRADDDAHGDFLQFVKTTASPYSAAIVAQLLA